MHVCIIGGSGFVGHAIAHAVRQHGHCVTIACRHPEKARDMQINGSRLVKTDVVSGRGLDEAVDGACCVINLVGLLFEKGRYTFEAVHIHGTEQILAACKRAGVRQYLHMSALGADSGSASIYARTKATAEVRVRQSHMEWAIFRPSIIYGAGDAFFNRFEQLTRSMPFLPVIEGNTRFQPVWVEDVARAFMVSIGNRHTQGKTYALGGPVAYSFRDLLEIMLRQLNRKRLLIPVPAPAARMVAMLTQHLPTPPFTPDQLILLQRDNVVEGTAFPEGFGYPANLEDILPTYLTGNRVIRLQQRLDRDRKHFWQSGYVNTDSDHGQS